MRNVSGLRASISSFLTVGDKMRLAEAVCYTKAVTECREQKEGDKEHGK